MSKTLAKKAARIAVAAKVSGGMFVFPTRDRSLISASNASAILNRFKYAEHSCTDCPVPPENPLANAFPCLVSANLRPHALDSAGSGALEKTGLKAPPSHLEASTLKPSDVVTDHEVIKHAAKDPYHDS